MADNSIQSSSNNKGTASFTVNSDGSVTIDIDWDDAAQAIVDGNDCKLYDDIFLSRRPRIHVLISISEQSIFSKLQCIS